MIPMICNLGINKFEYKYIFIFNCSFFPVYIYFNFFIINIILISKYFLREFPYEYISKENPYRPKLFEELDSDDLSW